MLECGDGTIYTGITDDLERRLRAHSRGQGAKYTRGRGPLKLRYQETVPDKSTALKREFALKRLRKADKLAIIAENERKNKSLLEISGKTLYTVGDRKRALIPPKEE